MGVLQAEPLKIATSSAPLAAVAAQKTLPVPSEVQVGFDAITPVKAFHVPQEVPLYSFTIIAEEALMAAQATCSLETLAQEGLPAPIALPDETKLLQLAKQRGAAKVLMKRAMRSIESRPNLKPGRVILMKERELRESYIHASLQAFEDDGEEQLGSATANVLSLTTCILIQASTRHP